MTNLIDVLKEYFNHTGSHEIHESNSKEIHATTEKGAYVVVKETEEAGKYSVYVTQIGDDNEEQETDEIMTGEQAIKFILKV